MSYPNVNEAGEPLISGEALRYEQYLDSDPNNYWCGHCGFNHGGDCREYDEDFEEDFEEEEKDEGESEPEEDYARSINEGVDI